MGPFRGKAAVIVIGLVSALVAGCRQGVRTVPAAPPSPSGPAAAKAEPAPLPAETEATLARMGYTVQAGAFAVLDNARALAAALAADGLDAFYFPTESGLFKVRFGNFPSREAALAEARKLKEAGRIGEFFVVGPADYAVFRPGPSGPAAGKPLPAGADIRDRLVATAESFIGVDYAWGGTTTRSGFDCSGLVLAVYQLNGLAMPRSVRDQFRAGTPVARDRLKKGDLVFFSASPGGALSHVGIYAGEGAFIHAPGQGKQVRRESLAGAYFKSHYVGGRLYLK
ncbi:MAG TPA: NlpC/P60 family protein [Candidatus Aminicenantes bacterium]|nr:NlpC/P60 family protein [Candidatus Aminicenantes bacterium]HRY64823.1 NlpC/P60 family protein [Candidatus Aminicenantes bacterium]HRZ71736.1 NlpC/P60 family protein [Candidatus Aminicenantes bacterium]